MKMVRNKIITITERFDLMNSGQLRCSCDLTTEKQTKKSQHHNSLPAGYIQGIAQEAHVTSYLSEKIKQLYL